MLITIVVMKYKIDANARVIIPAGVNVWPHELKTAKALINHGYTVEFKKKSEAYRVHSADAYIDGALWEFKAPDSGKLDAVERNLRRAKNQSCYIVFDSIRMKKIPDVAVKREIKAKAPHISGIKKIIFVNKRRKCIDIYEK